jgi:EAL domain
MDADRHPFSQDAHAHDISDHGARLSGLEKLLRPGDVIGVQVGGKKARCKVVWAVDSGLPDKFEAGVKVVEGQSGSTEAILKTLRARGVQLAVDDFGTGYSSLSYLRKFPIDALKIDQSFVRQITTAPDETSIVTAVISMGRSLKLRVIAEGVETQEELAFLQSHECDEAQGYYFSRPVLPLQFAEMLRTQYERSPLPNCALFPRAARAASASEG